jgi:MerR family transcriptional regulator, light-induced transcriptional regulator
MMMEMPLRPPPIGAPARPAEPTFHRSGAVARMLRMPVATLRVWERRYGLTQPELSPGGQRLYSAADVRRLALVKQLTDLGHAIGSLAPLDMQQLQGVAATHAHALAATRTAERPDAAAFPPPRAWRLAVIGAALGARLQRPALLRRLARPVVVLGPFEDAAHAAAALQPSDLDVLLIHEPRLHAGWLDSIETDAPDLAEVPKAVLYDFAADPVCEALATAGTALLREPQPDAVLGQWLCSLQARAVTAPQRAENKLPNESAPPRRWDDAALSDFAGRSSTIACECPRHVAELLVQMSHFEAYSAECENRSPADAELHAYLRQVAAASRSRFESALEQVALHQGLALPPSLPAIGAAVAPKVGRAKTVAAANPRHPP